MLLLYVANSSLLNQTPLTDFNETLSKYSTEAFPMGITLKILQTLLVVKIYAPAYGLRAFCSGFSVNDVPYTPFNDVGDTLYVCTLDIWMYTLNSFEQRPYCTDVRIIQKQPAPRFESPIGGHGSIRCDIPLQPHLFQNSQHLLTLAYTRGR